MADTIREVLSFDAPAARASERGSDEGRGWLVVIAVVIALAFGVAVSNLVSPTEATDAGSEAALAWGA